jgi:hypothetical protein
MFPVRPNQTCVKFRSLNLVNVCYGYYFLFRQHCAFSLQTVS